jgi:lysophospholipid acyltransferase (LPLAT)-like uncharacterized protein
MSRTNGIKNLFKIYVVPVLAALLLKTIHASMRWKRDDLKEYQVEDPVICVFWHGRQLMLAPLFAARTQAVPFSMLISSHADGKLIANTISWFGIATIYGSSSKGGAEAFQQLKGSLEHGGSVGITPDGPRGPRYVAKRGAVKLASITGKKIIPFTYSARSYWQFKSWDSMILPKPFSQGVCLRGEPITVPAEIDDEMADALSNELSAALTRLTTEADTFFA